MELRKVLSEIEKGGAFSLKWVTCDRTRGKGGQLRFEPSLRLRPRDAEPGKAGTGRPVYSYEESCQFIKLMDESSGRYFTVYKRLMLEFNGHKIVY
jgi:hypothetical protein